MQLVDSFDEFSAVTMASRLDGLYRHRLHCPRLVMSGAGIGVPLTSCDESRSYRTWSAAFFVHASFLGGSNGRARALPVSARMSRYANLFELPPPIGVEGVGFCKSTSSGGPFMANASSNGTSTGARYRPSAQFKPFEWMRCDRPDDPAQQSQAAFLNDARDIVQGAQTLVQLLGWDEDRRDAASSDADPAPLFEAGQRESLQRLLSATLGLLHARIEVQCEALT
ncbi:MAG TPA: hypothetical protein VF555_14550 [Variovorax sp.]